jgi:hypothetical protein
MKGGKGERPGHPDEEVGFSLFGELHLTGDKNEWFEKNPFGRISNHYSFMELTGSG